MVVPSAAVTSIIRVFLPVTKDDPPVITTTASSSVASATTSTSVVPQSRLTVSPLATSFSLTANTAKPVSLFSATFRVTE